MCRGLVFGRLYTGWPVNWAFVVLYTTTQRGVTIELQGREGRIAEFLVRLQSQADKPPLAQINSCKTADMESADFTLLLMRLTTRRWRDCANAKEETISRYVGIVRIVTKTLTLNLLVRDVLTVAVKISNC